MSTTTGEPAPASATPSHTASTSIPTGGPPSDAALTSTSSPSSAAPTELSSTSSSSNTAPLDPASTSSSSSATPTNPTTTAQDAKPKPKSRPFPSVTGGCLCNTIRYRLLTAPLFCYACHCPDCQRQTGSAFGLFCNIESSYISVISPTRPILVVENPRLGLISQHYVCPKCRIELWSNNSNGPAIADVRVGTLDYPSLMEPDMHSFVESKLDWIRLPEGARSVEKDFEQREAWPESSLRRLDACLERWQKKMSAREGEAGDGEKTPTANGEGGIEGEDDEAFEKRVRETERALQERLEKLRRKLEEEEGETGLEEATGKLDIGSEKGEKVKDGLVAEPVD